MASTIDERRQMPLRLSPGVRARLEAAARRDRRSMNAQIEHILDEHLPTLDGDATAAAS